MDLKEAILKEHSKRQTKLISDYIGSDQKRFDALMHLFFNAEYRVVQRGAWVISFCAENEPGLIKKHIGPLINNLSKPNLHDAVKRNTLKVFEDVDVPDKWIGQLVDHCFRYIHSVNEPIAVKAISINILVNTCKKFPELKEELIPLLNELLNHDSPAIQSCAKKGLTVLRKKI